MYQILKLIQTPIFWLGIILFIIVYPMLISIYVFFPLFIGTISYFFIEGIERQKPTFVAVAAFYLIHLEANLSLPLFLAIISALLFYLFIYPSLLHFKRCIMCKAVLSVLILDLNYFILLFLYDFIFQTESLSLNIILLYSLVVDLLLVMIL
ncbi:MAG: hypothetical protein DRQ78_03695 [Epsilonproteobacteria bacterium]|nr:MAG: hypothetical protein DRQ78_03695 [Campylobacterota bacterium]